jgi:hypothetical protein
MRLHNVVTGTKESGGGIVVVFLHCVNLITMYEM